MNRLFQKWLPATTLASWSAILLYFFLSGRVQNFLAPAFRPYVLVAGLVLAAMALALAFAPASQTDCCEDDSCGHSLSRFSFGKFLTFAVLLLPVSLSAVVSTDSFGKTAMENRGIDTDGSSLRTRRPGAPAPLELPLPTRAGDADSTQPPTPPAIPPDNTRDYIQRTPDGLIAVEVLDLLYAAQDSALRKDFEGKKVQLIGQLMPERTASKGQPRFKAVRMFMTCCAADARPIATFVETAALPDLPEMTWVKVVGTSTFPMENGRRAAVIKAERVEKTAPPDESLLY